MRNNFQGSKPQEGDSACRGAQLLAASELTCAWLL